MMEKMELPKTGKYIIAVSGGVDSISLLDGLHNSGKAFDLVVAHFDHGMRASSAADAAFVTSVAKRYGLLCESFRQVLGSDASEAVARRARYDFLASVQKKHAAGGIITAHHADDVVETMIINLLRGTGWRGLCSLKNTPNTLRPLLAVKKKEILDYAKQRSLDWREDETNRDTSYLRNQVRLTLMPQLSAQQWLRLYQDQLRLARQIETETQRLATLRRYDYIMWPVNVAQEMLRARLGLTRPQAARLLHAIKTARAGSRHVIGQQQLTFTSDRCVIK